GARILADEPHAARAGPRVWSRALRLRAVAGRTVGDPRPPPRRVMGRQLDARVSIGSAIPGPHGRSGAAILGQDSVQRRQCLQYVMGPERIGDRFVLANRAVAETDRALGELGDIVLVRHQY